MPPVTSPQEQIPLITALLCIDPAGLGGVWLRARCGPARNRVLAHMRQRWPGLRRLNPQSSREDLLGGIDLAATLAAGQLVTYRGALREGGTYAIPMAERVSAEFTTILASSIDTYSVGAVIALDEGAADDEALSPQLADRLAFQVDLADIAYRDLDGFVNQPVVSETRPSQVDLPYDLPEQLVRLASQLGIQSLRAPSLALRAARAHAALFGRDRVDSDDITQAVALVYAHRATQLPAEKTEEEQPDPNEQSDGPEQHTKDLSDLPEELLIEAVKAALPADVLVHLAGGKSRSAKGSGSGVKRSGNRKGRPLPATQARARSGQRIDLLASLRAALPWQGIRKPSFPDRTGPIILPEDLRAKRYQEHSDHVLIFTVDASGSAAIARLGEAKGAIEILLADAYARRDHVALIAFRGLGGELLLPPTRSLVQTKRRLAELPGGGGTPTASGLKDAHVLARQTAQKGLTPTIILFTDGRSNVSLEGRPDRKGAAEDALLVARAIARDGIEALVIDAGKRPEPSLSELARQMRARYLKLPRADAKAVSSAVSDSLDN